MSKSKRLVELIMSVNAKKKFTVSDLAEEFGVSYRTILRDLQELGELGVPLYSEVGASGGYRVLKERLLPPISFTESEAISMFFVSQSLKYYKNLPFENESSSALKKFYHYLPKEVKNTIDELNKRLSFWVPTITLPTPFLKDILAASLDQKVISILYDSETNFSRREVQPVGVYTMKGLWYFPAFCFKSKTLKLFRVDRIKEVSETEIQNKKTNLDDFTISDWLKQYNETKEQGETLNLVARLSKMGVKKFESDMYFYDAITLNEDGSGVLDINIPTCFTSWLVNFFIGCGTDAIVKKPESLRKSIKEALAELYGFY